MYFNYLTPTKMLNYSKPSISGLPYNNEHTYFDHNSLQPSEYVTATPFNYFTPLDYGMHQPFGPSNHPNYNYSLSGYHPNDGFYNNNRATFNYGTFYNSPHAMASTYSHRKQFIRGQPISCDHNTQTPYDDSILSFGYNTPFKHDNNTYFGNSNNIPFNDYSYIPSENKNLIVAQRKVEVFFLFKIPLHLLLNILKKVKS